MTQARSRPKGAPEGNDSESEEEERRVGVLMVHGMGSHKKGDTLEPWLGAIARWFWHRAGPGEKVVVRDVEYNDDDSKMLHDRDLPPEGYLDFVKSDGTVLTWHAAEAWWDKSFKSPPLGALFYFAVAKLPRQFAQLAFKHFRSLRRPLEGRLDEREPSLKPQVAGSGQTASWAWARALLWIEQVLAGFLYLVAFGLAFVSSPLVLLFVFILVPLTQVPVIGKFTGAISNALSGFLVDSMGDIHSFVTDDVRASRIIACVNAAANHLAHHCSEIIIVAHSTGTIISHEAIVRAAASPNDPKTVWIGKVTRIVTIANINRWTWSLNPRPAMYGPLPARVRWYNLYASADPAVPGCYEDGLPERMRGRPEVALPHVELAVTNERSILRDHSAYFENYDQVVRLLASLMAEHYQLHPGRRLHRAEDVAATASEGATQERPAYFDSTDSSDDAAQRIRKVWPLLLVRLPASFVMPVVFFWGVVELVMRRTGGWMGGPISGVFYWKPLQSLIVWVTGKPDLPADCFRCQEPNRVLEYFMDAAAQSPTRGGWLGVVQDLVGVLVVSLAIGVLVLVLFVVLKAAFWTKLIAGPPEKHGSWPEPRAGYLVDRICWLRDWIWNSLPVIEKADSRGVKVAKGVAMLFAVPIGLFLILLLTGPVLLVAAPLQAILSFLCGVERERNEQRAS